MLVLNVWENQQEIEETFVCDEYYLMYGTVEDILDAFDGLTPQSNESDFVKILINNRKKINNLLMDVFPDMTAEQLKKIKVKELIPFFTQLFDYVVDSINSKN